MFVVDDDSVYGNGNSALDLKIFAPKHASRVLYGLLSWHFTTRCLDDQADLEDAEERPAGEAGHGNRVGPQDVHQRERQREHKERQEPRGVPHVASLAPKTPRCPSKKRSIFGYERWD